MGARLRLEQHVLTFFFFNLRINSSIDHVCVRCEERKKKKRAGKSEKPQPEFIRISQPASQLLFRKCKCCLCVSIAVVLEHTQTHTNALLDSKRRACYKCKYTRLRGEKGKVSKRLSSLESELPLRLECAQKPPSATI